MAMTKKMNRRKKKHKSLSDAFNQKHILQMSNEEKEKLKEESKNFFDNLPDDFHTDLRYADGVEFYNNTDKKECHKAVMALLFL
ncbi:hypothetical protein JW813_05235 [Clostridium botulinum]|uniref:hypothetical protein n=1 Tax=Clostridium botulinum TaxID=1491 RepID=UPI0022478108|nr:hypothetical protein [Clostridium botulinum]UZP04412.1 hypothetical protein JW813_05235 [Clostridium botulinum]UZP07824.1 hypothetical protein JYA71_05510 [Clostridium botulinum]UZP11151.1 hypothetical protein JYA74_05230 [Clostridium botulinum]